MGGSKSKSSDQKGPHEKVYQAARLIEWDKTDDELWKANIDGQLTSDDIQSILRNFKDDLNEEDRKVFQKARSQILTEWACILSNATIKLFADSRTYIIKSGKGTNVLTVQQDGNGTATAIWNSSKWKKVESVAKQALTFILGMVSSAFPFISAGAITN